MDAESESLPEGWAVVPLGELGRWGGGGTPSRSNQAFWDGGAVPWVSPKDMKSEFIVGSVERVTERALAESRLQLFPAGTLLFVVRGMILARAFPVGLTTTPVAINQDIRALIPCEAVAPEYLLRVLQHQGMRVLFEVKEATHGTLRLESETLQAWPIPVAPLKEQLRITERLREAFKLIRSASGHLRAASFSLLESKAASLSTGINRLSQAVLEKAFKGELVPTEAELARQENRSYEPATELLARLKTSVNGETKRPRSRKSSKHQSASDKNTLGFMED